MSTKLAPLDGFVDRDAYLAACRGAHLEPCRRQEKKWRHKEGAAWAYWTNLDKQARKTALAGVRDRS